MLESSPTKLAKTTFLSNQVFNLKFQYIDPCMSVTNSHRLLRHYWHWHCVRFPCQAQGHTLFHWVVNACWEWPVSVELNNPWFAAIRRQSEIFLSKIIISSYTGVTVAHSYASSDESSLRYYRCASSSVCSNFVFFYAIANQTVKSFNLF